MTSAIRGLQVSMSGGIGGNDSNTHLLLHMDGADAGTTFTDVSQNAFTVTANGNAQTHTTSFTTPKFGTASLKSDGTGDYLSIADAANNRPGAGDFTIDFWIYYNAGGVYHTLWDKGYTAAASSLLQTTTDASPKIQYFVAGVNVLTETTGTATGVWVHKAIVRSSGTMTFYSGGTANGTAAESTNLSNTSSLYIGAKGSDGSYSLNGNIDEYRFSKTARWTANFTPPAAPYS